MSVQSTRNVRRNVSPGSTKQAPMRATLPVSLMRQGSSPTKPAIKISPSSSPTTILSTEGGKTKSRKSPDTRRLSPEIRSPGSPSLKAEKSKTLNPKGQASPVIRRTASLDAIYLKGQWPRDSFRTYCGTLLVDKSTQTPEEWEGLLNEKRTSKQGPQTRSSSIGSGDQIDKFIREKLHKNKEVKCVANGQRHSPFQGDHTAISCTPVTQSTTSTRPVAIPNIPKPLMPRMRNSVEGLNQEIERLVLKGTSGIDDDLERFQEPTPDGHRAPIAELLRSTRNVNTQTPSSGATGEESIQGNGPDSRCPSMSPPFPMNMETMNSPLPSSQNEIELNSEELKPVKADVKTPSPEPEQKLGTSPHNKFLSREPPDGCERVKVVEESRLLLLPHRLVAVLPDQLATNILQSPDEFKPRDSFILQPSQGSAFCPLRKSCLTQATSEVTLQFSTAAVSNPAATIEGQ